MATNLQASSFKASGEAKGKVDLPEILFGDGVGSRRVLHDAVVAFGANQRRGTSMTKTRGLVSGGGRKPWKQKGTGNARAGSIRSPLWRKGGIIFGPVPRSYRIELDATKKRLALQTALVEKAKASELGVIEDFSFPEPKTRQAGELFKKTGLSGKLLLVVLKKDPSLSRALGNLARVRLVQAAELNALMVMSSPRVLFTQSALEALVQRFPKG
jgi:large subunit ribosomal protein L4